jgi:hypothetical protein
VDAQHKAGHDEFRYRSPFHWLLFESDSEEHRKAMRLEGWSAAPWFETRSLAALLTMRLKPHNTRLLSFTFSASRYTLLPISLNLALIFAIPSFAKASEGRPSSRTPLTDIPTEFGSFNVAA